MKSVLITFDQAHYVRIIELLDKLSCRDVVPKQGNPTMAVMHGLPCVLPL